MQLGEAVPSHALAAVEEEVIVGDRADREPSRRTEATVAARLAAVTRTYRGAGGRVGAHQPDQFRTLRPAASDAHRPVTQPAAVVGSGASSRTRSSSRERLGHRIAELL